MANSYANKLLKFEGEYLNGERNGKGKEYYDNGDLKFEGEYLNEKIWNGKIYNPQGVVECGIKEGKGYIKEYTYSEDFLLYPFPFHFLPIKYSPSNLNLPFS